MAIAFPRSLRALNGDRFRPSLWALGVTTVLVLAWIVWFFFGSVPIYETSSEVSETPDGLLAARFPAEPFARLAPNQTATLQFSDGTVTKSYGGTVERVDAPIGSTPGTALIFLNTNARLPQPLVGQVRIEVETLSPLSYALRAVQKSNLGLVLPGSATPTP